MTSSHSCDQILSGLFLGSFEAEQSPRPFEDLIWYSHIDATFCTHITMVSAAAVSAVFMDACIA